MANWSTTTKHEPSSINNGRRYELRDRVSIEQLNNMTENAFYAMEASSVAKEKAEQALEHAISGGSRVLENGQFVAEFNADKKVDTETLEQNYYNKQQVDDILASGSIDVDLSNYYKKSETYSREEVDDKLANLDVDIDFSDYYTKAETNDLLKNKADKSVVNTIQDEVGTLKIDNASNKASISNLQNLKANKDEVTLALQNKADKSEIPYVGNFITNAVDDLVNYYTKAETYSQAEVRQLISAIPKFNIEVVTGLPTSNISETTIYLLKTSETETNNLYTEYIYINNVWEKLGTQKLDLSGYVTTEALNTALQSYYVKEKVDSLLSDKADKSEIPDVSEFIRKDVDNLTNYYKKSETYTKTETDNLLNTGLSTKANKSELESYVTKTGLESTLVSKGYLTQDALNGYATESYVSTSVAGLDSQLRTLINNKADVSVVEELDTEIGNVAYNLSTVKNQYLKAVAVTDDGKTLQVYDQDNKATLFEGGSKSELVVEHIIAGGSTNEIIPNLNLKANEIYDIFIVCSSNVASDITLKINNISTGYKYIIKQGYWYEGASANMNTNGSINNGSFQIGTTWTTINSFHINLCNFGNYIAIESQETALDSTTNYLRDCSGVVSANTTITSLTFTLSSSTFKSGGKILIFKRG